MESTKVGAQKRECTLRLPQQLLSSAARGERRRQQKFKCGEGGWKENKIALLNSRGCFFLNIGMVAAATARAPVPKGSLGLFFFDLTTHFDSTFFFFF